MADEDELKESVKEALRDKDGNVALELLIGDEAYNIGKNDRNRLAALAIKDAYVAPYYTKIVGLLSGDSVKKLSEDLGRFGEASMVFEVLEDPEYRNQVDTIVSAAISSKKIAIAELYALAVNRVSDEVKDRLITALGRNVTVSNEQLVTILGDPVFSAHRNTILQHLKARMDADELEEFLEEASSVLTQDQINVLESAIERKRKHE